MSQKLIIVESPTKVKKVLKYMGKDFKVLASMGHVRDLPTHEIGVDVKADFAAQWQPVASKKGAITRLVKAMQAADTIYLATDPDREGEAIAAHLLALTALPPEKTVYRVTFNAITESAVLAGVANPRQVDAALVSAQHARRKLDRLVGYLVSPLACRALDGRFSAGRVQSPALRLVVEREQAIQAFVPETYYTLSVILKVGETDFLAKLSQVQGQNLPIKSPLVIKKLLDVLRSAVFWVGGVETEIVYRQAPAPFTTSTLQQAASSRLGFSPEQTMRLAQGLYETALITYMRTDSPHIAPEAQTAALDFIGKTFGEAFLPTEKPHYPVKAHAQEAHEAIRPTEVTLTPDHLKGKSGEGAELYKLIWQRFVASQMAAGEDQVHKVAILAGKAIGQPYPLQLQTRQVSPQFLGFRQVYQLDVEEETIEENHPLPSLMGNQPLHLVTVKPEQKQTTPPARYTEAQLISELDKRGIGRPSTYAAILSNLKDREYLQVEKKRLLPTENGLRLNQYLSGAFASLFTDDYTARLEYSLDEIASGKRHELEVLQAFWGEFQPLLRAASAELPAKITSLTPLATGEKCPQCGRDLVQRIGAKGAFIGCSGFPQCRYTVGLEHQPLQLQPIQTK